jgi:hypothetical protein
MFAVERTQNASCGAPSHTAPAVRASQISTMLLPEFELDVVIRRDLTRVL